MVDVKKEISLGTLIATVGLVVSLVGLGTTLVAVGVWRGQMETDMAFVKTQIKAVEVKLEKTEADSRALIRLQSDMDYLKRAVDELRAKP